MERILSTIAVLGPFVGLGAAFGFQLLVRHIFFKKPTGFDRIHRLERIFGWLLLAMVIIVGASRGGNDVSKAVGMLVMVFPDPIVWPLLLLLGSTGMGIGLFVVGRLPYGRFGRTDPAYHPRFSAEDFGLVVRCRERDVSEVDGLLRRAAAKEVTLVEA